MQSLKDGISDPPAVGGVDSRTPPGPSVSGGGITDPPAVGVDSRAPPGRQDNATLRELRTTARTTRRQATEVVEPNGKAAPLCCLKLESHQRERRPSLRAEPGAKSPIPISRTEGVASAGCEACEIPTTRKERTPGRSAPPPRGQADAGGQLTALLQHQWRPDAHAPLLPLPSPGP